MDELGSASRATDGRAPRHLAKRLVSAESRSFAFRLAAAVAFVDDNVVPRRGRGDRRARRARSGFRQTIPQRILGEVQEELFGG